MKKSYLVLEFNGCTTTVELLDTPIAKRWAKAYTDNKNLGLFDYKPEKCVALFHEDANDLNNHCEYNVSAKYSVDQINFAIDDVMASVRGQEFPHRAFEGMTFTDTNFIHRCFTTAGATRTHWVHGISEKNLFAFKKHQYEDPDLILSFLTNKQFEVVDFDKFDDALHRINKWIHIYEGFLQSSNTRNTFKEIEDDTSHILLDWDNFNSSHIQIGTIGSRTSYDEISKSFPINYDDYDVLLGKFILGKDYETAFSEEDNPLEFDITNVDGITGVLRIQTSDKFKQLYSDSPFTRWAKSAGLTEELYLPPPIGKIVDSTCDLTQLRPNHQSDQRWSSGVSKPFPPFDSLTSYIIEK